MKRDRRTVTRMGLAAIAASSALVLGACGGNGNNQAMKPGFQSHVGSYVPGQGGSNAGAGNAGGGNSGGSAAMASSCVPSSQVLNNTKSYDGKQVTITGTVAQVVSQHAFTVAANTNNGSGIQGNGNNSNRTTAQTLLAVDKQATQPHQGSPVQVTGTLQPAFNSNQAATFTGGNLGQGAFNSFNGKPYVQAEFAGPISANLTRGAQSGGALSGGNHSSSSCAAVTDVLNNMRSYDGKQVTITGTIAQVLGPHAITVAATGNNANRAQTLLAVAKKAMPLIPGSRVQVTGTLQPTFNANQAETFTGSNLNPATFSPFNGKPYVQAVFAGPASANLAGSNNQS